MNPTEEQIIVNVKRWWASFAVWFNGAVTALIAADWSAAAAGLPNLQQYLSPSIYHWIVVFVALMNIIIRVFKTKGPVQ